MDTLLRSKYPFCSAPDDNAGSLPEQSESSGVPPRKKPRFSDEFLHASTVADTPQHPFFKTRLCTKFQLGSCIYGANCHYAHGAQELRRNVPGLQHYHHQQQQSFKIGNPSMPNLKNIYWKTRLCNKWEATGCCPYAERCQYAHGHAELRKPGSMETDWINIEVSGPKSSFTFSKDDHPIPHGSGFSCDTQQQQQEEQQQPQQQEQEQHQQPQSQEQRQIRWRELKRNSRIYGDWINDIPVVSPLEQRDVEI